MDSQALSLDEQFFLKIALKNGILDGDQAVGLVEEKMRLSSSGDASPLDQLMRDRGFITETEVRKIREAQTASQVIRLDSQYADVAVQRGLVDRDMIQWAFDRQREQRYSVRVGQLLVDAGHLEPSQHRELLEVLLRRMDAADQAPSPGPSPAPEFQGDLEASADELEEYAEDTEDLPRLEPGGPPPPSGFLGANLRHLRGGEADDHSETENLPDHSPRPSAMDSDSLIESALELRLGDRQAAAGTTVELDNANAQLEAGLLSDDRLNVSGDLEAAEELITSAEVERSVIDDLETTASGQGRFDPDAYVRRRRHLNLRLAAAAGVVACLVMLSLTTVLAWRRAEAAAVGGAAEALDEWWRSEDAGRRAELVAAGLEALSAGSPVAFMRDPGQRVGLEVGLALASDVVALEESFGGGDWAVAAQRMEVVRDRLATWDQASWGALPSESADLQERLNYQATALKAAELEDQGRLVEAARQYRVVVADGPPGVSPARERLLALEVQVRQRHEEALGQHKDYPNAQSFERLVEALRSREDMIPADAELVQGWIRELKYERSYDRAKTALEAGRDVEALEEIALARRHTGNLPAPEADLDLLEAKIRDRQKFADASGAARSYERSFQLDKAMEAWRRAIREAPDDGSREAARAELRRLEGQVESSEFDAEVAMLYAEAVEALRGSNAAGALKIFEQLSKKQPDSQRWRRVVDLCRRLEGMVYVPPGPFIMGSDAGQGKDDERPRHERMLSLGFFIDRTEITNRQYKEFAEKTKRQHEVFRDKLIKNLPDHFFEKIYVRVSPSRSEQRTVAADMSKQLDHPVRYVTFQDATEFARWSGKRLPREDEWEKAARGTEGITYPWGNEIRGRRVLVRPRVTNIRRVFPTASVGSGSFADDESPYGCRDMAGNVCEWTTTEYRGYPGSPPHEDYGNGYMVVRGGSFDWPIEDARCARRQLAPPKKKWPDVGFRCVLDVPTDLPELRDP